MPRIRRNGKAYDSADVEVVMDGEQYDEVTEITYGNDQEHQLNHSLSSNATSYSVGKVTPKCSLTLYMADVVRIEKKWGSLLAAPPFDIQVSFVNESNDIVNDTIICKFQSEGRDVTGEMGLKKQFEMFAIKVKLNS